MPPSGGEHLENGGFQALVGVGFAEAQPEDFPAPVLVHAAGDDGRHRHHPATLANFEGGRIEPFDLK